MNKKSWRFVFIFCVQLSGRNMHRLAAIKSTTKTEQSVIDLDPFAQFTVSSTYTHTHTTLQPVDVLRANDCDDRFCMEVTLFTALCSSFPPFFLLHFLDILKLSLVDWMVLLLMFIEYTVFSVVIFFLYVRIFVNAFFPFALLLIHSFGLVWFLLLCDVNHSWMLIFIVITYSQSSHSMRTSKSLIQTMCSGIGSPYHSYIHSQIYTYNKHKSDFAFALYFLFSFCFFFHFFFVLVVLRYICSVCMKRV